jgi:hypothetical protein
MAAVADLRSVRCRSGTPKPETDHEMATYADPPASIPADPGGARPPRRPGAATVITAVNGTLAGVGGVYASTHSVVITVIAAVAAIALAAIVLIPRR